MRPVVIVLLALAYTAMPAGCGSGSSSGDGSSSTPPEATTSSSPSAPKGPVDTYADIKPATGKQVRLEGLTLRLPSGFSVTANDGTGATASSEEGNDMSIVSDTSGIAASLGTDRKIFNRSAGLRSYDIPALKPVVVDGVRMFHQKAMLGEVVTSEAFGFSEPDQTVSIEFDTLGGIITSREQKQIVESVMASVEVG